MIVKVNVTLLKQFLGVYCPSKLIIWLTHDVFLISFLFRIVCNENQIHLPLFMINKVSVYIIKTVSCFYCLSKLILRLTHDVFLISLLFRIVCTENQFHLPLFMNNKVNVTFIKTVSRLVLSIQAYYMAKLLCFLNDIII